MSDLLTQLTQLLSVLSIPPKLDKLLNDHKLILANQEKIMSVLSDLQAAVAAEDTEIDSVLVLLKGLKDALDAAGTDPVALAALSADIQAKTAAMAAAVVANTPAASP